MFLVVVILLPALSHSFKPLLSSNTSITHRDITVRAVFRKTAEVCRNIAAAEGRDFTLTIDDSLTAEQVQRACSPTSTATSLISTITFLISITTIYLSNAAVDVAFALSQTHHFDDESFQGGRDIITAGVSSVKASVKKENFEIARRTLGQVFHTLQDFYSHSNWVELGKNDPYSSLIKPDIQLENLAGPSTPTCRSCTGGNCEDNILPEVLIQGILTSGYFNIFSSEKPAGKCSHGGSFDQTSKWDPVGGINKDDVGSSHGSLHHKAADLAVIATMELLEDIRLAVGDKNFLRLVGVSQSSVLCFVIDTTGSMSDDIAEAKRVSFDIIDRRRGTEQESSAYILVPFNDPDFGPVMMTTDADIFKASINKLSASGGGDNPEMSLSGLQLALTAAPSYSDIFVFTDAPAKDAHLKGTVIALIESSKSTVTFMLTSVLSRQLHYKTLNFNPRTIGQSEVLLYRDLARVSGGQTIEVAKADLSLATSVIEDSTASAVVTVFQVALDPGKPDNFTFTVDGTLRNVTAYITGSSSLTFKLTSPSGVSQVSTQTSGPLASITTVGNLRRLSLSTDNQTGSWEISIDSDNSYSLKVIGQSSLDFIFNLVELHEGPLGDFNLKEGRLLSGGNISVLISVTGSDTVNVTDVTLFDRTGPAEVKGSIQSVGSGNFLVTFVGIPAGEYFVHLRGDDSSSTSMSTESVFQRQSSTQLTTSSITVNTQVNNTNVEPGSSVSITFTVATTTNGVVDDSTTRTFKVRASHDRNYDSSSPTSVTITPGSGGVASGTVTVAVPADAASGTDVTITIEAENEATTDINNVVQRFSVSAKVTDITPPVCQGVSSSTVCPSSTSLCASSQWEYIANITDGINGTGVVSVNIRRGNGTLNTSRVTGLWGENMTIAIYSASCCSPTVELAAVDGVGNVVTCMGQARPFTDPVTPSTPATTSTTPTTVQTTSTVERTLGLSHCLWISPAFLLLLNK